MQLPSHVLAPPALPWTRDAAAPATDGTSAASAAAWSTPEDAPLDVRAPGPERATDRERELCARALGGDADAWNALIARHDHRVVVALLARGVRIDRAKDIAQEAWMRLVEQQRAGRLTHLVLPGLAVTQATFLALEAARRDGARGEPLSIHDGEAGREAKGLADPAADVEARLLTNERVTRVERALASCSPSARRVFALAYGGDGLAHAEVAQRVGLSLQRVRQILCEVRAKLRDALEDAQ